MGRFALISAPPIFAISFSFQGDEVETMLQRSEALDKDLRTLKEEGAIGGFDAAHRYLPSQAAQLERQDKLPSSATFEADLVKILTALDLDLVLFFAVSGVLGAKSISSSAHGGGGPTDSPGYTTLAKAADLIVRQDGRWFGFVPLSAVQDLEALTRMAKGKDGVDFVDLKEVSATSITSFRNQALIRLAAGMQ